VSTLAFSLLAGLIAGIVVLVELVTSKYRRSFFLLGTSKALWAYGLIYAVVAFVVRLVLGSLIDTGALKLQGVGVANPWVQSVAIGLSIKAVLHIRLFTVGAGATSFPVGIETVVQLFEPWLLETVDLDELTSYGPMLNLGQLDATLQPRWR
jgi:hypothetical protein